MNSEFFFAFVKRPEVTRVQHSKIKHIDICVMFDIDVFSLIFPCLTHPTPTFKHFLAPHLSSTGCGLTTADLADAPLSARAPAEAAAAEVEAQVSW